MRSCADALAAVWERLDRTAADQDPGSVVGNRRWRMPGYLRHWLTAADLDAAHAVGMFG